MRDGLPPLPPNMAGLPEDPRGYPIPWFVYVDDQGKPDFRVIGPGRVATAFRQGRCWLCGRPLGRMKTFVIGPMCAINRVSSEPPSHLDCATFAAMACPFLTRPLAKRNDRDLPPEHQVPSGEPIYRNPGVTLVWGCLQFKPFFPEGGGVLFEIGKPSRVAWFREGREATRAEVMESIETGLPILRDIAEREGVFAVQELGERYDRAMQLLPRAA